MKVVVFWMTFLCPFFLKAQSDTVLMRPIEIMGFGLVPYATGDVVRVIHTVDPLKTLDAALFSQAGIYMKNYGHQQLSTISFRGTSAVHTNVLWHGIPVNAPTLGSTDFSQWHAWLIDDVAIQPGNQGALYGSGSIGGTVFIDHFNKIRTNTAAIGLGLGSFGYNFQGGSAEYKKDQLQGTTHIYREAINNDFTYPLKGTDLIQTQQNAAALSYGFRQELQHFWNNQRLSVDLLLFYQHRESQPVISQNYAQDFIKTHNIKSVLEHFIDVNKGSISTTLGWINDQMIYNQNPAIRSQQITLTQRYEYDIGHHFHLNSGFLISLLAAKGSNLENINPQKQLDFFMIATYRINDGWSSTLGLRESFMIDAGSKLLPSLGAERKWIFPKGSLVSHAKIAKGFRYPTLNDRFWLPGGNPSLKPEQSASTEIGFKLRYRKLSTQVNVYQTWAQDWILWLPQSGNIWRPENIQKVAISGIEYVLGYQYSLNEMELESQVVLNYQRSINKSAYPSQAAYGNQLPYVPYFTAIWSNKFHIKKLSIALDQSYTSRRYTTLDQSDTYSVDPYFLLDIAIDYPLILGSVTTQISIKANNIFNSYYENIQNRAMPGINFQLQIITKL